MFLRPLTIVFGFLALTLVAPSTRAAQHVNANVHQWWNVPASAYSIDQEITVVETTDACFFALVVFYQNVTTGAYMGLQQLGDGSPLARFSVWDSTAATPGTGASCRDFGGEGIGKTCELPFAFQLNHPYKFRMWRLTNDGQGNWWGAWIIDQVTGKETKIGEIRAPVAAGDISAADSFDEYWGDAVPCDLVPPSSAIVSPPTLNAGNANTTASSTSIGDCSSGRVTALAGGKVKLELGINTPKPIPDAGDVDADVDASVDAALDADSEDAHVDATQVDAGEEDVGAEAETGDAWVEAKEAAAEPDLDGSPGTISDAPVGPRPVGSSETSGDGCQCSAVGDRTGDLSLGLGLVAAITVGLPVRRRRLPLG